MATFGIYLFLLSLTFTYFNFSSCSSTEADILLSFKASIEDSKRALSDWSKNSSTHYCNWTGITCSTTPSLLSVTSLNLQNLNLSGVISSSICDLPNLSYLNLANNMFNQPIPLHLSQCSLLENLNLSNNLIWGTIPMQISELVSLKVLDFSMNHIEGYIPESLGSLKNLQVLNMGSNLLSGSVPEIFGNLTYLTVLDLSKNPYLVSEIPKDIGKLGKLKQLLLQSSSFYGEIPNTLVGLHSLTQLDLSDNNLTGGVPQALATSLRSLVSFDVSENKLLGPFPNGICKGGQDHLISLSIHTNAFTGSLPKSITECKNLERFQVQDNGFSGDFPIALWSLPKIKLVRAENNRFSGQIPESISRAVQLEQVQLDYNNFSGKIPQGLGFIKSLYRFSTSHNHFYGELPPNFCDSPVMSIVNLSHNYLSGQIPELRKCRKLVSLSLSGNYLTGEIPLSLAELPVLTYLDLSDNNLTGSIPQGLQNLKLALFNVSFNKLHGKVPYSLISGLPASYLEGNPDLCGPGLSISCSESDDPSIKNHSSGLTSLICVLISVSFVVATVLVACVFVLYRRSCKGKQISAWHSVFFYPLRITEHDLLIGVDNEKSPKGKGGVFGSVYIVRIPSGELVAVKRLVNFGNQSSKSLKAEVKTLAKIRHKNIVKILGFCHSDESIFLIYEYLKEGSLGDLISCQNFQLEWGVRLRIAIGVAQGLAYLHKDYVPHLLHRNVKSKNIMLDANFEPKLTDFALDRVVGESAFQSTIDPEVAASSSCYIAPEYGYNKKATAEYDIYSFGVVLLELVTGRQAEKIDSMDSLDIVKWVRRKVNISNGVKQVLDPKISHTCEQEMIGALDIALHCTSVVPEKRPLMVEVVRALQSLESRTCIEN